MILQKVVLVAYYKDGNFTFKLKNYAGTTLYAWLPVKIAKGEAWRLQWVKLKSIEGELLFILERFEEKGAITAVKIGDKFLPNRRIGNGQSRLIGLDLVRVTPRG